MEKGKIQFNIYKLHTTLNKKIEIEKFIKDIVNGYNKHREVNEYFNEQNLKKNKNGAYNFKLFYQTKKAKPKWLEFLEEYVEKSEEVLNSENIYHSIVIFIYNSNSLYGISKGQGNFLINNYIEPEFGIDILSRIIDPQSNNINSLSDISLIGNILSEEKFYRRDHNLLLEDTFGKVYKNLKAKLTKDDLKWFELNDEIFREISCDGASFFALKTVLTFEQLVTLIKNFQIIQKNKKSVLPKTVEQIIHSDIRNQLNNFLIDTLESLIRDKNFEQLNLEIIHPTEFENFLKADNFKLRYSKTKEIYDVKDIAFLSILEEFETESKNLKDVISKIKIQSFDENGLESCKEELLLKCFTGEINYNNSPYFILEGRWYKLKQEFSTALDEKIKWLLESYFKENLIEKWNKQKHPLEGEYNEYIGNKSNFISLDKVTKPFNYIEIFDLIEIIDTEEKLRIFHVKEGFDQNMRDLTYQAEISAKYIFEDRKQQSRNLAKRIYNEFKENDKRKINEEKFIKYFYNSNLEICLAIKTGPSKKLSSKSPEIFNSSIAKYSLFEASKEIMSKEIGLLITEI